MSQILDTLNRLEDKFDSLAVPGSKLTRIWESKLADAQPSVSSDFPRHMNGLAPTLQNGSHDHDDPADTSPSRPKFKVPGQIMLWPSIYLRLVEVNSPTSRDLDSVLHDRSTWLIKQEMSRRQLSLPSDERMECVALPGGSSGSGRVQIPSLNNQTIQDCSDAYFNTFNVAFPLLDRSSFMDIIVPEVIRESYGIGNANSVLALLVFALGQVAMEGVTGSSIETRGGQPSGIRGGTVSHPPGLAMFNEARQRLGFVVTQCSLEVVQIMLLQAIYFESSGRPLDSWRSAMAASSACHLLIRSQSIEWPSPAGDLVRRAYWTCVLYEDVYHVNFDLPRSEIMSLEDDVPLSSMRIVQYLGHARIVSDNDDSQIESHFLAMTALRKLMGRHRQVLDHALNELTESSSDQYAPPLSLVREMLQELESWRSLLPRSLQWSDADRFDFPNGGLTNGRFRNPLFGPDLGPIPIGYRQNLDTVISQLRSWFYYARFSIYRPFVYKALHFPELMQADDAECCALASRATCMWPVVQAPPKNKKRLVPHLSAWTQIFWSILLVYSKIPSSPCLAEICQSRINHDELHRSMALMLDWVKDAKRFGGAAGWVWDLLEPLYLDS